MKADNSSLSNILNGDKQFRIPLFQRAYSWDRSQWQALWDDLAEIAPESFSIKESERKTHFIGAMVTLSIPSTPRDSYASYLVIDGQQRLTTMMILLSALRNVDAKQNGSSTTTNRINTFLLNANYHLDFEKFKLLPTQQNDDRNMLTKIFACEDIKDVSGYNSNHKMIEAYIFFQNCIQKQNLDKEGIQLWLDTLIRKFEIVLITLDEKENPYAVFESLNNKGIKLSQADLIRNHVFSCFLDPNKQEQVYKEKWKPIEDRIKKLSVDIRLKHNRDLFTEFMRYYLTGKGTFIRENEVFEQFRKTEQYDIENGDENIKKIEKLDRFSRYYERIINYKLEPDSKLRRFWKNVAYLDLYSIIPVYLNLLERYVSEQSIQKNQLIENLKAIESWLARIAICGKSNAMNKVVPIIAKYCSAGEDFVDYLGHSASYPSNDEFLHFLSKSEYYGNQKLKDRAVFLLTAIELSYNHPERPDLENISLSVEHIMPQSINNHWERELGQDFKQVHQNYLHKLGNLSLIAQEFNSESGNKDFTGKKNTLIKSNFQINKELMEFENWNKESIEKRQDDLMAKLLEVCFPHPYPDFRRNVVKPPKQPSIAPHKVILREVSKYTNNWKHVLVNTFEEIANSSPEALQLFQQRKPTILNANKDNLRQRDIVSLIDKNGNTWYLCTHASSKAIIGDCVKLTKLAGWEEGDWKVIYKE